MKVIFSSLFLCLGLMILTGSCKKSSSGSNQPANNSYLSSIWSYAPQTLIIDSFTYDNSNRMITFGQYDNDTVGIGNIYSQAVIVTFSYTGTGETPSSYSILEPGNPGGTPHNLYYDSQNRIIKDSSVDGSGAVTYFSYPPNMITAANLLTGSWSTLNQLDTLLISNNNIRAENIYTLNSAATGDSLVAALQIGYSSLVNPCYHASIANTIGPLLDQISSYDGFGGGYSTSISANALDATSGLGVPAGLTLSYVYMKDSKGRAATLTLNAAGISGNYYSVFNYY